MVETTGLKKLGKHILVVEDEEDQRVRLKYVLESEGYRVVDFGTHSGESVDYPDFAADLPLVLERAREAGTTRIITIGTDLTGSPALANGSNE